MTIELLWQHGTYKGAPLGTVQAFEQAAIAREAEDLREAFEERAGILEQPPACPRSRPSSKPRGSRRPLPAIGPAFGRPYARPWRITPYCCPRCPTGPARSIPYPFCGTATVHGREGAKPRPVSGNIVITEAELEAARKGRPHRGTSGGVQRGRMRCDRGRAHLEEAPGQA